MLAPVGLSLAGPRAAFAELLAEMVIGLALLGGRRGKLVGATLRLLPARLVTRPRGRRVAPA